MSNSKVINNKKHIIFAAIFIYFWFFYIDTGSDQLSPEELESYKVRKGKLPPEGNYLSIISRLSSPTGCGTTRRS